MADTELIAGVDSYVLYGEESTFGTEVAGNTHFGLVTRVNYSASRQLKAKRGFKGTTTGGQAVVTRIPGTFDASITVEFNPISFAHLEFIQGAASGNGSSGTPFSYTRTDKPASLTIVENFDNVDADTVRNHQGCVCTRWEISAGENEEPTCRMDFKVRETEDQNTLETGVALPSGDPYNFDGLTLEAPDGSAVSQLITGVTLTIERQLKWRYGMNELAQSYGFGTYDVTLRVSTKYLDETFLTKFLGGSSITAPTAYATAALKFTNGANKYVDFVMTDVWVDEPSMNQSLGEDIPEEIILKASYVTVGERTS